MSKHTYKVVEVVGSSPLSIDDAIKTAVSAASETLHNIGWFEVIESRGHVQGGKVAQFQVSLKLGFTIDEPKRV